MQTFRQRNGTSIDKSSITWEWMIEGHRQLGTQVTVTENLLDYFNFLNHVRFEWVFKLHKLWHLSEAIILSKLSPLWKPKRLPHKKQWDLIRVYCFWCKYCHRGVYLFFFFIIKFTNSSIHIWDQKVIPAPYCREVGWIFYTIKNLFL